MHEQAENGIRNGFSDQSLGGHHLSDVKKLLMWGTHIPRNEQKMIIMHPNEVTRSIDFSNAARKRSIGSFIVGIVRIGRSVFSSNVLPKQIMEQRPQS